MKQEQEKWNSLQNALIILARVSIFLFVQKIYYGFEQYVFYAWTVISCWLKYNCIKNMKFTYVIILMKIKVLICSLFIDNYTTANAILPSIIIIFLQSKCCAAVLSIQQRFQSLMFYHRKVTRASQKLREIERIHKLPNFSFIVFLP